MTDVTQLYKDAVVKYIGGCHFEDGRWTIPDTDVPWNTGSGVVPWHMTILHVSSEIVQNKEEGLMQDGRDLPGVHITRLEVRSPVLYPLVLTVDVTGHGRPGHPKDTADITKKSLVIAAALIWRYVAIRSVGSALTLRPSKEPVRETLNIDVSEYLIATAHVADSFRKRNNGEHESPDTVLYCSLTSNVVGTRPASYMLVNDVNVAPKNLDGYTHPVALVGRSALGGLLEHLQAELRDIYLDTVERKYTQYARINYDIRAKASQMLQDFASSNYEIIAPNTYMLLPDIGEIYRAVFGDPNIHFFYTEAESELGWDFVLEHIVKNIIPKVSLIGKTTWLTGYTPLIGIMEEHSSFDVQWDVEQNFLLDGHAKLSLSLRISSEAVRPGILETATKEAYATEFPDGTADIASIGLIARYQDVAVTTSQLVKSMITRTRTNHPHFMVRGLAAALAYRIYNLDYITSRTDVNAPFMAFFAKKSIEGESHFRRISKKDELKQPQTM